MGLKLVLAVLAVQTLAGWTLLAQVHVERSQDGKVVVTDHEQGGQVVYAPQGSVLSWRHKDGWLEVYEPSRNAWMRAPGSFPLVQASGSLVFAFGPGASGSAVYDASRKAWVQQFNRYNQGAVSETLAVGYGGPGGIGIYDTRTGAWQSPNITGDQLALSDSLVALFGGRSTTSVYDSVRGTWKSDIRPFSKCVLGENLVAFYGPPGTDTQVYDVDSGHFVLLREAVLSMEVFGGLAVGVGDRHRAHVYSSPDGAWVAFKGEAESARIVDGLVLVTDTARDVWVYRPGKGTFEKTGG